MKTWENGCWNIKPDALLALEQTTGIQRPSTRDCVPYSCCQTGTYCARTLHHTQQAIMFGSLLAFFEVALFNCPNFGDSGLRALSPFLATFIGPTLQHLSLKDQCIPRMYTTVCVKVTSEQHKWVPLHANVVHYSTLNIVTQSSYTTV